MMRIANPIYDVVFKHLMEDIEIARGLIGRLLGVKVLDLQPLPQEITDRRAAAPGTDERTVRLFRLDFAAEVEWEGGQRHKVLIELQKALASEALGRFRNYLGKHYARPPKKAEDPADESKHLPIIAIYFLGFTLGKKIPKVVRVERRYLNAVTRQALPAGVKDEFLERLTHDAIAVQIPLLDDHAETELERALAVFDQRQREDNPHFLVIKDGMVAGHHDPLVQRMIRKLLAAAADADTQAQMDAEDEIGDIFESWEGERRLKEEAIKREKEERRQKEEERRQKEEALGRMEEERHQKEEERHQKEQERHQKEEERRQKEQAQARLAELEEKLRRLEGGT